MRALIAVTAALCLSACSAETENDPFFAAARALGLRTTSSAAGRTASTTANEGAVAARTRTSNRPSVVALERPSLSGPDSLDRPTGSIGRPADTTADSIDRPGAIPSLDIQASCRYADDHAIDHNLKRCLLDETKARDELTHRWAEFFAAYPSQCSRYASRGGGTYTDLLTCLEMDVHAGELNDRDQRKDKAAN